MGLSELFSVAVQALRRNKLRSGLTLLGVIIGVATVVSVLSVISGLNEYVTSKVVNLNPDVLVFTKFGIIRSRAEFLLARKRKAITLRDMRVVEEECRSCGAIGAQAQQVATIHAGKRKLANVPINGYTANVSSLLNVDLQAGRFFTPAEEQHAAPVAVIGTDVNDQLFPGLNPLERTIYVRGYPLRVIGLQTHLGNVLGQNKDNVIFVPVTFLQKVLTSDNGIAMMVRPARGMPGLTETEDEVRTILRSLRKTPYQVDDPFGVVGSEAIQALWRSISAGAFALMLLISGISLVVGAIVIANIMFVTVVERTPEIGLRMALGARRRDIRRQFLVESALLSAIGGAIGVLGGSLVALVVSQIFPAEVRLSFVALGLGVATFTGILAGLAPSSAAANLPPVEAIRQE
ncbi:MAG TPA: ABC transporter permease [Thermoanaerobaculia bacterium]|jgi:putative ABC transport system permease protein|nr:ABC transporter permease [Thermoanaerobaculia bacterium]